MNLKDQVKKPIEAIQCANTFSLLQRKMYNVLLANAAGNLKSNVTHRIAIGILCKHMGYHSRDYKQIKDKFRELRRMDIEWDIINEDGNKVWTNTSPLSLARVIEGEGVCEYEFTPSLLPYLDRPAQYARFSLTIMAKFKSSYGLALYENCERYKNIGQTKIFDINVFRKLMGVQLNEYTEFYDLKRRVIDAAVKEVNLLSGFQIEPLYTKSGRKVDSIQFRILKNEATSLAAAEELQATADSLDEQLRAIFGLSEKEIAAYKKRYGSEYVAEKISVIINSESFKKGMIRSMQSYLKSALNDNYQATLSSQVVVSQQKSANSEIAKKQEEKKAGIEKLKTKYEDYKISKIRELVEHMTDNQKTSLFDSFNSYIGDNAIGKMFKKCGLTDYLTAKEFIKFLESQQSQIADCFMSFEDYSKIFGQ